MNVEQNYASIEQIQDRLQSRPPVTEGSREAFRDTEYRYVRGAEDAAFGCGGSGEGKGNEGISCNG